MSFHESFFELIDTEKGLQLLPRKEFLEKFMSVIPNSARKEFPQSTKCPAYPIIPALYDWVYDVAMAHYVPHFQED